MKKELFREKRLFSIILPAALLALALAGCTQPGGGSGGGPERSFYMGFTPWPYRAEGDFSEYFYTYDLIQDHGDIVAHHFQQGVPWPEAYAMKGSPSFSGLPDNVEGEYDMRILHTDRVSRVYLAIDSLDSGRNGLIGYYGTDYDGNTTTEQQPRPNNSGVSPDISGYGAIDWSSKTFADQETADAFVSYARSVIDKMTAEGLEVAYFNYASEITDLLLHDSAGYADFLTFADRVYGQLKAAYPGLPLMASAALKHPDSADMTTVTSGLGNLMEYVDILGISVYPYAFFNPPVSDESGEGSNSLADLPADWASQIKNLAGGKPVAFTETGWIAEDLSIGAYSLDRYSSEENQRAFAEELFRGAQSLDAEFIIWFSLVDYSYFWQNTLGQDALSAIWRDTGLFDYDGATTLNLGSDYSAIAAVVPADAGLTARTALALWDRWLSLPRK